MVLLYKLMAQQVFIAFGQVKQCIFHNAKKRVHALLRVFISTVFDKLVAKLQSIMLGNPFQK